MTTNYSPQPPVYKREGTSWGTKIVILGLQCFVLMVGALMIWILLYARQHRSQEVVGSITDEWGRAVYIRGPLIVEKLGSTKYIAPEVFNCDVEVNTKSLHRNIYEAEVFNATVSMKGSFVRDNIHVSGDSVYILLRLPEKQIAKLSALSIGDKTVKWTKGDTSIYARVALSEMPETIEFSTDFDIHGSRELYIDRIGEESTIIFEGEASSPSFRGESLPEDRSVTEDRFYAKWESKMVHEANDYTESTHYTGVEFLVGVDRYQKVSRSLKYAFLIIVLTYTSVVFAEILTRRSIPLLNYFLIGVALILFYSLLLSFAEHLSFGISYLIASTMTVALITGYMWKMLHSRASGIIIGLILTILYVSCYILLSLTTYALLLGSMLLFIALGVMMYCSLKLGKP